MPNSTIMPSIPFLGRNTTYRKPIPINPRARWAPESAATYNTSSAAIWSDMSGNGFQAFQAGPSLTTGLNGYSAMTGNNTRMPVSPTTVMNALTAFSVFAVIRTPSAFGNLRSPFGMSEFNSAPTNKFNIELSGASYPCVMQMRFDTTGAGGVTAVGNGGAVIAANTWYTVYGYYSGAAIGLDINGGTGTPSSLTGTGGNAVNFYLFGPAYVNDSFNWNDGRMLELIIYTRNLSAVERQMLHDYSKDRYGI